MSWVERVMKSIFPLSVEKENIQKALKEWFYTGETYDLGQPLEDCEICGHSGIRYQFTIQNRNNKNELLIGSECITRFDISAIGENGEILNREGTSKKVRKDRNKLVTEARKKRLINTLVQLSSVEEEFNINSFIEYYDKREAFTPKQLKTLIWRLNTHEIKYKKSDFKMTIRRNREKEQLSSFEAWELETIWDCLSSSQKEFCKKELNYNHENSIDKRLLELLERANKARNQMT